MALTKFLTTIKVEKKIMVAFYYLKGEILLHFQLADMSWKKSE